MTQEELEYKAGRILQKLYDLRPTLFYFRNVDFILQKATPEEIGYYYYWFFEIYEKERISC